MNRSLALRRVLLAAAFTAVAQAAPAQTTAKPPPRLPPNPSDTARIPAGVDTGSPTTSGNQQLGTPVGPSIGTDRKDLTARSAAARAAARPKPTASGADCTKLLPPERQAGDSKAVPVPVPRTGVLGNKAPPTRTPPAVTPGATRVDC